MRASQREESAGGCSSPSGPFPLEKKLSHSDGSILKSLLDHTWLLQAVKETIASYPVGVSTNYTDGYAQTLYGIVRVGY